MDLLENMRQAQGPEGFASLARAFNITPEEAAAAVAGVLPELTRRIERNTLSRGGLADLIGMMGEIDDNPHLVGAGVIGTPQGLAQGNAILEQVLGNRDASRALAARASQTSGLTGSIVQAMLPYIASMVIGGLTRGMSGGLGDILARIPQLGGPERTSGGSTLPQAGLPRAGFPETGGTIEEPQRTPAPMPGPQSRQLPTQFPTGGSPLPGPEGMQLPGRQGGNPYGDLSETIRRGGRGASVGGSPLWSVVRNVLGGILGFQSRGLVSWLIRMVVMRYGWSILRTIFTRVLLRR